MKTILLTADDLAAIRPQWQRLADKMASPLCGPEWFESSFSTFGTEGIHFVALDRGGTLSAIAPLRIERVSAVSRLEFFDERIFEPHQFLYEDLAALELLASDLLRRGYPLHLTRMPVASQESMTLAVLAQQRRCVCLKSARRSTAYVDLNGPPLEEVMRSSALSQIRRKLRKGEQLGKITFEFHSPTPATVDGAVDEVYRVESSGWKGREASGLLFDTALGTFFRTFARKAASRGILHIGIMRIGGEAAAVRLGVEQYGKLWESKIGYDERFASCSPGMLLTHETLKYLQRKGMQAHMFLGNYDRWQDLWNPVQVPFETIRVYPPSLGSAVALAVDGFEFAAKRFKQWSLGHQSTAKK